MSAQHLTIGSEKPEKDPNKVRLYSMKYCPYAYRPRLVLLAKGIPHDIVNINLINKPEWYFKVHSEGKVPALETDSKGTVIVESLTISDYLDEQYPDKPLYSKNPDEKRIEKDLIAKIEPITVLFAKCGMGLEKKTPLEWVAAFTPAIEPFEVELSKRATTYFGGEQPGMVDFMLWPWAEYASITAKALGEKLPFEETQFPVMRQWRKTMRTHPIIQQTYNGPEKFWKSVEIKFKKIPPDYDAI